MGKNGRSKANGNVVRPDNSDRPGWKGPSYVKKKAPPAPKAEPVKPDEEEEAAAESAIPLSLQQLTLSLFKDTFSDVLDSNDRQQLLQDVKTALYERDFARAFGRQDYLEAYSIRWSPSRALCYQSMLVDVSGHLIDLFPACATLQADDEERSTSLVTCSTLDVICFGGGAAEVVAFGGLLRFLFDNFPQNREASKSASLEQQIAALLELDEVKNSSKKLVQGNTETTSTTTSITSTARYYHNTTSPKIDLTLIDSAQWAEVSHKLTASITTSPPISKYANATAKAANHPLLTPGSLTTTFYQENVLAVPLPRLQDLVGKKPMLITLLFTLNELYTTSISLTTKFLLNLTMASKTGTILLVVDSPGSYSETTVNGSAKKYPMKWLLDHTLLTTAKMDGVDAWEKVLSDDSRWFRVREELRYPIQLENMRYQIHVYRRV